MLEGWILPIAILFAFAVILLAPLIEAAGTTTRKTAFFCPVRRRDVTVEFLEQGAFALGKAVDVHSCSAFEDTYTMTCGKQCLELPAVTGSPESVRIVVR